MKTYKLIVLALAAFSVFSCEKASFLDRKPYTLTTPGDFYTADTSRLGMALKGCYEMINGSTIGDGSEQTTVSMGTFYQGLQWILGAPSDEILSTSTSGPCTMAQGIFIESDNNLIAMWTAYFHGIYRCNEFLVNLDKYKGNDKDQYEGEVRFLRGFYYHHLALVFGALPIVSYGSDGKESRSSLQHVYDLVIKDYKFAYEHLNARGIFNPLSANKYTAAAYLARVCNYLAACKRFNVGSEFVDKQPLNDFSWVDAVDMSKTAFAAAKDVIDNSGYVLIDKYDYLFRETTKADQYKECLFLADLPLSGSEGKWPESARLAAPWGSAVCPQVWGATLIPNPMHFYLYDKTDPRRDHNFHCGNTGAKNGNTVSVETIDGYNYPMTTFARKTSSPQKYLYDSDTQTCNAMTQAGCCPGKFRLVESGGLQHAISQHAISYPLMRLADVYLMAAEAEYFISGEADNARSYLRPVVLRAAKKNETLCNNLMTAYQRSNFIDELLEHRERELIFEVSRKTDLIRFGKMDEAIAAMSTTSVMPADHPIQLEHPTLQFKPYSDYSKAIANIQKNWRPYKIWAPISEAQRTVNPNLSQNAKW